MGIGDNSDFLLSQAKFLAKKFRETASADATEERRNDYFAGYAESFLMLMAVRYPEVRKEMEDRIIYREFK